MHRGRTSSTATFSPFFSRVHICNALYASHLRGSLATLFFFSLHLSVVVNCAVHLIDVNYTALPHSFMVFSIRC